MHAWLQPNVCNVSTKYAVCLQLQQANKLARSDTNPQATCQHLSASYQCADRRRREFSVNLRTLGLHVVPPPDLRVFCLPPQQVGPRLRWSDQQYVLHDCKQLRSQQVGVSSG